MLTTGTLLLVLAVIGIVLFGAIGWVYGAIKNPSNISAKDRAMAVDLDMLGENACSEALNKLFLKDATVPIHFGIAGRITISYVIGQNNAINNLTKEGVDLYNFLKSKNDSFE